MYILQLFDNHSATYSALIIGCSEVHLSICQSTILNIKLIYIKKVTVMAWVYGADQFLEDLKFMLGFYPFPYFFWKWGWKLVSPVIVVVSQQRHHYHYCEEIRWKYSSVYPAVHGPGLLRQQVRRLPLPRLGKLPRLADHLLLRHHDPPGGPGQGGQGGGHLG